MAQIITATAEPDAGRVRILATGGTPGDGFYVVRKDQQGSNLIRETTGDGVVWQPDPASAVKNLFQNPGARKLSGSYQEVRRNWATNPNFKNPTSGIAGGWTAYSTGTVTGTRTNNGSTGQFLNTSSINVGARWGIQSTQTFTATTRRVFLRMLITNGTIDTWASMNVTSAKVEVDFKLGATVVQTKSVTLANWNNDVQLDYTGGSSVDSVVIRVFLENNTAGTVTAPQRLQPIEELLEITSLLQDHFYGGQPADDNGALEYVWNGTADNSTTTARRKQPSRLPASADARVYTGLTGTNGNKRTVVVDPSGASNATYVSLDGDSGALRSGMLANKTYTVKATIIVGAAQTGTLHANARKIVANTKVGAAAVVSTASAAGPASNGTANLSVTFTVPAGATEAYVQLWNGSGTEGETVAWTDIMITEGAYAGPFIDGTTPNATWDGLVDDSTSTIINAALPITMYDYEARQGYNATYTITNEVGVPDASYTVSLPKWGTWLKDPFRPFKNVKLLWHGDSEYIRSARRERLHARGAKFPVFHSDVRSAPAGTVMVATETEDEARALTSMLDKADTIMIDVDSDFGVPVRYVSVGDIAGRRASSEETTSLTWEARIWTLQIDEVEMPIGAPVNQGYSYDQLASQFGSYVAIPATVATYDDLAAGIQGI